MAHLELLQAGRPPVRLELHAGQNIIGSAEGARIRLDDPLVPAEAAMIEILPGSANIRPLQSPGACYVNMTPLTGIRELGQDELLIFGSTRCRFHQVDLETTRHALEISQPGQPVIGAGLEETIITARNAIPPPAAAPSLPPAGDPAGEDLVTRHPHLRCTSGEDAGRTFFLQVPETTAGTAPECGIRLKGRSVVSRQAKLIRRGIDTFIIDLQSNRTVLVNGRPVVRQVLREGDRITLGEVDLIFHLPLEPPAPVSPTAAEASAPSPAPSSPAARPAARKAFPWRLAVPGGIFIIAAIIGTMLAWHWFTAIPRHNPAEIQQTARQLEKKRDWPGLSALLASPAGLSLPEAERERLGRTAGQEPAAAQYRRELELALKRGDLELALEQFDRIFSGSVYRQEAASQLITFITVQANQLLARPVPAPGDWPMLATLGEKLSQIDPGNATGWGYRSLAALGRGDPAGAAGLARQWATREPDAAEARYCLALALFQAGQPAEARTAAQAALDRDPASVPALLLKAKTAIALGQLAAASEELRQVLARDPANANARQLLNRLDGRTGTPGAATADDSAREMMQNRIARQAEAKLLEEAGTIYRRGDSGMAIKLLQDRSSRGGGAAGAVRTRWQQLETLQQYCRQGRDLSTSSPAGAAVPWEQMRQLEQAIWPGRQSVYLEEAAERLADYYARAAVSDLQHGDAARAYTLARKALSWQPSRSEAAGVVRQVEDQAGRLYTEGFRLYQGGNREGARQQWEQITRLVTSDCNWHQKALEKLAGLEEPE